eukprot:5446525-Lingulodinium_polyedra.AAC.1
MMHTSSWWRHYRWGHWFASQLKASAPGAQRPSTADGGTAASRIGMQPGRRHLRQEPEGQAPVGGLLAATDGGLAADG